MRAVIDTGVLVSALIRRQGATADVLRALRDGRFSVIYSTDSLVEIIDVLGRVFGKRMTPQLVKQFDSTYPAARSEQFVPSLMPA